MASPPSREAGDREVTPEIAGKKQFIRDEWYAPTPIGIKKGDYVLASKYRDGDPGDHFCIGFYDSSFGDGIAVRHLIIDGAGQQFRRNGFRRVAKIGCDRGEWIVKHLALIERFKSRYSVWHWYRAPWSELREFEGLVI
jgi:hypothetical protein